MLELITKLENLGYKPVCLKDAILVQCPGNLAEHLYDGAPSNVSCVGGDGTWIFYFEK
jgi:hypothetical protein